VTLDPTVRTLLRFGLIAVDALMTISAATNIVAA